MARPVPHADVPGMKPGRSGGPAGPTGGVGREGPGRADLPVTGAGHQEGGGGGRQPVVRGGSPESRECGPRLPGCSAEDGCADDRDGVGVTEIRSGQRSWWRPRGRPGWRPWPPRGLSPRTGGTARRDGGLRRGQPPERAYAADHQEGQAGRHRKREGVERRERHRGHGYRGGQDLPQLPGLRIGGQAAGVTGAHPGGDEQPEQGEQADEADLDKRQQVLVVGEEVGGRQEGAESAAQPRVLLDEGDGRGERAGPRGAAGVGPDLAEQRSELTEQARNGGVQPRQCYQPDQVGDSGVPASARSAGRPGWPR